MKMVHDEPTYNCDHFKLEIHRRWTFSWGSWHLFQLCFHQRTASINFWTYKANWSEIKMLSIFCILLFFILNKRKSQTMNCSICKWMSSFLLDWLNIFWYVHFIFHLLKICFELKESLCWPRPTSMTKACLSNQLTAIFLRVLVGWSKNWSTKLMASKLLHKI